MGSRKRGVGEIVEAAKGLIDMYMAKNGELTHITFDTRPETIFVTKKLGSFLAKSI